MARTAPITLSSARVSKAPVSGVCLRDGEVFATSSTDILDEEETIVGYVGRFSRLPAGKKPVVLHESKDHGFVSLAPLASGDFALGTTDGGVEIVSANGKRKRSLDTLLKCEPNWLAAGGTPERLFAATTASGGQAKLGIVEWTTDTWTRRAIPIPGTSLPALSDAGVTRVRDDRRVAEYEWQGSPKLRTGPVVGRGRWACVRARDGWFLLNYFGAECSFVDLDGKSRWSDAKRPLLGACAAGGRTVLGVGSETFRLIDTATGKTVASVKRKDASGSIPVISSDGAGAFAIGAESGVELLRVRPFDGEEAGVPASRPTRASILPAEAPEAATLATFERLVDEVCEATSAKTLARLHEKLASLDLLEASDAPGSVAKLEKGCRRIRAHRKRVSNLKAQRELENILDTITDS